MPAETQELKIQTEKSSVKETLKPGDIDEAKQKAFDTFLEELKTEQKEAKAKSDKKPTTQEGLNDKGIQDQKEDQNLVTEQIKQKAYLQATVDTFKEHAPDTLAVIKTNITALKPDESPSEKLDVFSKANTAFETDINSFKNADLHEETLPDELTTAANLVKEIQTAITEKTAELADHELLETTYKGIKDINTKDYFAKYTDVADLTKIQKAKGYDQLFNKTTINFKDIETNIIKETDNAGKITYQTIDEAIQTRIDEINAKTEKSDESTLQKTLNYQKVTEKVYAKEVMETKETEFNTIFDAFAEKNELKVPITA